MFFKKKADDKQKLAFEAAKQIKKSVNKEALESIWDVYCHIKKAHPEQYGEFDGSVYKVLKGTWEAMEKLIEYKGDFNKFGDDERQLLKYLRDGHLAYSDAIHILIDHHDDKVEAEYIFEAHPKLHNVVPKEYDNTRQILEVLLEYTKDYQWQFEHFSMNHYGLIEAALGKDVESDEVFVSPN